MMKTYYTVYRTNNLVNGKFYIGVHKTRDPYDSYLGSGDKIVAAIRKYKRRNFEKKIIAIFSNRENAYSLEKALVTEKEVRSQNCYNVCLGGMGGNLPGIPQDFWTPEKRKIAAEKRKGTMKIRYPDGFNQQEWSESRRLRQSLLTKAQIKKMGTPPQGKIWITNWVTSKIWSKEEPIPDGWERGNRNRWGKKRRKPKDILPRFWITNGVASKLHDRSNPEIPDGWYEGRVFTKPWASYGKAWIKKLNKYLEMGVGFNTRDYLKPY